ncbi:insulin-like growth factor-binding protein-related protein 1 [Calliopsis andreniformis]|uniref:insulin-like growth factor-binding protein-related protein 1 n=1 Tax=Calliopsis andreniformis TaxID=337506 RepID=UPI003FCC7BBF
MVRRRTLSSLSLSLKLLVYFGILLWHDVSAYVGSSESKGSTKKEQIDGCIECGNYRCPEDPGKCLLGSVPDPCECCKKGLCARLDGEPCWNSSISEISVKSRNHGFCARNYLCKLRSDLEEQDEPQSVCVCMEQSPACGSNNKTYTTPCALHEQSMRLKSPSSLKLQHLGPCESRPWIVSPLENILTTSGQRIALNCEVKGFPIPDIFWEFQSADGKQVLKLPAKEHEATIHINMDAEALTRSSWLQLPRLGQKHVGKYYCIANNTLGEASTTSHVTIV